MPADALTQPSHDGGAAVVEVLAHLRDWDEEVGEWVTRILSEETPPHLDVPDDSLWAIEHDYAQQDPAQVLADFHKHRTELTHCLAELPDDAWDRVGNVADTGNQSLQVILDGVCSRDAEHLARMREALT